MKKLKNNRNFKCIMAVIGWFLEVAAMGGSLCLAKYLLRLALCGN